MSGEQECAERLMRYDYLMWSIGMWPGERTLKDIGDRAGLDMKLIHKIEKRALDKARRLKHRLC